LSEAQLTPARPGAHKALAASGDLNPIELTDLRSTGDRLRPIVEAVAGVEPGAAIAMVVLLLGLGATMLLGAAKGR
jgi:hypothetical protein